MRFLLLPSTGEVKGQGQTQHQRVAGDPGMFQQDRRLLSQVIHSTKSDIYLTFFSWPVSTPALAQNYKDDKKSRYDKLGQAKLKRGKSSHKTWSIYKGGQC